jgi:hypothetical protein
MNEKGTLNAKDTFTLFGKPFQVTARTGASRVYFVRFGLFNVMVTVLSNGEARWQTSESDRLNRADSKEAARDAAEIELRRIVRECFEIAGEMEATGSDPHDPWDAASVRFRDL